MSFVTESNRIQVYAHNTDMGLIDGEIRCAVCDTLLSAVIVASNYTSIMRIMPCPACSGKGQKEKEDL